MVLSGNRTVLPFNGWLHSAQGPDDFFLVFCDKDGSGFASTGFFKLGLLAIGLGEGATFFESQNDANDEGRRVRLSSEDGDLIGLFMTLLFPSLDDAGGASLSSPITLPR